MDELNLRFDRRLQAAGYSITKPRKLIFATLAGQEPVSMSTLCRQLSKIDRASVYRTVNLFIELGIVERLTIGWKYKLELTDEFSHHHHHATCLACGTMFTLPGHPHLEKLLLQAAASIHFSMQAHQIELRGYCQHCTKKIPGKPGITGSLTLPQK